MVLASYALVAAINLVFSVGEPIPLDLPWRTFLLQFLSRELLAGWGFLLACFLYVSWQELRDSARMNRLRAEELEKERLQAMLTQLKDQMNPHFLFNTLNTVASLIPADPAKAERVLVKLSALYQGVLASTRRTLHPLSQELDFCRDYLDIEKARFGRRLKAVVGRPRGLAASRVQVPVLLLQPLVENAVKHGLSSRAAGGSLKVSARRQGDSLVLSVEDDGVGFGKSPYSGSGTALGNCRKRLELAYGKKGSLQVLARKGGGTRVEVVMPLLKEDP
jgi:LytS/YehU family sensor histidine kinase